MGRVFVTGDTHGGSDILKLTHKYWPEGSSLTDEDLLVICGDFGLIWSEPPSEESAFWLDWLNARPWTTLFLDGNHENHDLLDSFDTSQWHGGKVHVLPHHSRILHLMRGQTYSIPGHGQWFVMGGARSQDREWRIEGESWWRREMPSDDEYDEASQNLSAIDWAPTYVFTHDCPTNRLAYAMPWYLEHRRHLPPSDALTNFLQYVDERLDASRLVAWYCGHYHQDLALGDDRHFVLYQQIVELGKAPATCIAAGDSVPGVGVALPDHDITLEEAAEREHATLDEVRSFALSRSKTATTSVPTHLSPDDQLALRRRINALRRLELRASGPAGDIL